MPLRSIAASFGVVGLLGWVAVVGPANAALASSESVAHATTVPFGRSAPTCLKVLPISLLKTYVGSVLYLEEQSPKRDSAEGIQQCFFSKKCPACSTGRVFGYVSVTLNNNEPLALFKQDLASYHLKLKSLRGFGSFAEETQTGIDIDNTVILGRHADVFVYFRGWTVSVEGFPSLARIEALTRALLARLPTVAPPS